jgi:hypothetical protein
MRSYANVPCVGQRHASWRGRRHLGRHRVVPSCDALSSARSAAGAARTLATAASDPGALESPRSSFSLAERLEPPLVACLGFVRLLNLTT